MKLNSSEWKEYRIEELGQVVTGHTPSRSDKDNFSKTGYIWIKPTDIRKGERYVLEPEEYFSQKAYEKYKKSLIPPMSTCVVTIGTVGEKICLTNEYSFTNQAINAVIPNQEEFDPSFVFYLLKFNLNHVLCLNTGTASGRENVCKSSFSSIIVKVPSKPIQCKISTILAGYDTLLENNTRRIKILEEMAQAIYREWLVHFRFPGHEGVRMVESELGLVPEGWEIRPFSDIADFINGYAFKPSDWSKQGIPIIKIVELKNGITQSTPRYSGKKLPEIFNVTNGDILFSWSADLNVYIWSSGFGLLNQHLFNVYPKENFSKSFLFYSLNNRMNVFDSKRIGTTMKHIRRSALTEVNLVVPNIEVRTEFDDVIQPIIQSIINLNIKNANLRRTRDLLLPKLISGEIDVSDLDIKIPDSF